MKWRIGPGTTFVGASRFLTGLIGGRRAGRAAPDAPQSATPDAPRAPAPPSPGAAAPTAQPNEVVTPRGRRVAVQAEVVDASSLIASHGPDLSPNPAFPAALQPRDRSRAASKEQVARIAANLEPALLGASASASEGAPIVGPDNVVESGNARTAAIRQAYQRGLPGAQAYRQFIEAQGFNTAGIAEPILIRRRTSELSEADRQAFTREANERTTLGQSATEQAANDAKALTGSLLDLAQEGRIEGAANRDFARRFIDSVVPQAERAGMFTTNGALSQDGIRRIQNALFAKAYSAPELMSAIREDSDTNAKAIGDALLDAAPSFAQMRAGVEAGAIPANLDITSDLLDAVALVRRARTEGTTVRDLAAQEDLFAGGPKPEVAALLRLMFRDPEFKRPRSKQNLAAALNFYAREARKASTDPQLIGGRVVPFDILNAALERLDGGLIEAAPTSDTLSIEDATARLGATRSMTVEQANANLRAAREPQDTLTVEQANERIRASSAAGENFVGMVDDAVDGTRAEPGKPSRRDDILRELVAALGIPIYTGRIKSQRILGFFRPSVDEVRIKRSADIEVAAHEIAHLLDNKFPEIRAQWNPASNANKEIREELRGVSYDQRKLYEGFAEFVRLWATQKNQAKAAAPKFYQWFENFLDRNEHGVALRKAQADMHSWFGQDALSRARSKIGVPKAINAGLVSVFDRFRQAVADDLHGVMKMERDLTGAINPVGAYETARLTRAKHTIVEGALIYGAPVVNKDGSHSFKGQSLKDILEPIADNLDDALLYFVGKSSSELFQQGREHLFTDVEIEGMLRLGTPEFRKAFDEYQTWNRKILDFAEAKGIIAPGARSRWRRAQYLPFHRVGKPGAVSAVPGDFRGIQVLTGGTDNIRDVLGNMIGNAAMLIDAALTNEARMKIADLARQRGGARFIVQIPTDNREVKIHRAEVERAMLKALGVRNKRSLPVETQIMLDQIVSNFEPFVSLIMRGQPPVGNDVVAAMRRGKPVYFQVADPLLYKAMLSLNRPLRNMLIRSLSIPKRIGQASITLTPDFMMANFARDTLMGSVMSQHGFKFIVDSARGMISRIKSDDNYREFIANGGGFASYLVDDNAFRTHLEQFYTKKGIDYRTVMDTPAKLLFGLERIADAFEMATRLGEFQQARKRGAHQRPMKPPPVCIDTSIWTRKRRRSIGIQWMVGNRTTAFDALQEFCCAGI